MNTTQRRSFVSVAMTFSCWMLACPLTAEEPTVGKPPIVLEAEEAAPIAFPRTIPWSLLAPENGKPFHDPFAKLTQNQLSDLGYVVRVQRLIAAEKIKTDGVDAKEAARLRRKLTGDGIDIGWLMTQRDRVHQYRKLQTDGLSKEIAAMVSGRKVTLTGYVIPIKIEKGRLTEFFLVPSVAACSHESAPPRLQVVYVTSERGIARPEKGVAIRVTGNVEARTTTRSIPDGNGQTPIRSAYAIASASIATYPVSKP